MIDRITDAGQCDYYEVIIKVIMQGLSGNCLKIYLKGEKLIGYCRQHRTTDFRIRLIRDEIENLFNCTRMRFEQHKHGEKTIILRICISSFVHCYGKQKSLRIVGKKNNGTAVSRIR